MSIVRTLEEYDRQIERRRQQINVLRVEIAQIEDARRTALWLEEEPRQNAAHDRQLGLLNGAPVKPLLIVRNAGTGDEDGTASKAAKTGKKPKELTLVRARILKLLDGAEPMLSREIGDHLGIPRGEDNRKAMNNALYMLRMTKVLTRDPDKRYSLARLQPQPDLDAAGRRMPRQGLVPMRQRLRSFLASAERPMKAEEIRMAMDIELHSLDYKLLGQSLSAMKRVGELTTDGEKPFAYRLAGAKPQGGDDHGIERTA